MAKTAVVGQKGRARTGSTQEATTGAGQKANNGASASVVNGRARVDDPGLARLEHAMQAAAAGDFSVRLPARRKDDIGRLESAFNHMAARNAALEAELVRVAEIIGREGRMTERARLHGATGGWSTAVDSVNGLIDDLVRPTTEVARVIVGGGRG
jgi:methyl-accepting chemotaxis protein